MRVCGIGTLGQAAFIATLALWPLLFGCGGGSSSGEEQSSSHATQQPGQRAQSGTEKATSGDARFSAENLHKLDRTIAQVRRDKNLPGVLVGVSVPGEGEYVSAQGSANLDTGTKPQSGDQFRIGSVTKTFVATAILQLVEEGKLRKSDTLSTWYPDFPNAGEITVDDLLRMRSGIPPLLERGDAKALLRQPPAKRHERGHHRGHGGQGGSVQAARSGNGVLGHQLQHPRSDTGESLRQRHRYSARSEHHRPLGLENTFYPTDDELPGDLHGYGLDPKSGEFEDKTILNPAPSDGAGGDDLRHVGPGFGPEPSIGPTQPLRRAQQARLEVQRGEGYPSLRGMAGDREIGQALGSWRYDRRVQHRHVVLAGGGRNHRYQRQPL